MKIRNSINIKYDMYTEHLVDEYYATSSHSAVITSVLEGVMNISNTKSHIAYGPYGAGKSYISLILSRLLKRDLSDEEINLLVERFSKVDINISSLLKKSIDLKDKYIIVNLNGYEGDFDNALIRNLNQEFKKYNLDELIITNEIKVKSIINQWKTKHSLVYDGFMSMLNDNGYKENEKGSEKIYFDVFNDYYFNITGKYFYDIETNQTFIEVVEKVCPILKEQGYGIFVVYDEFGRLLQNVKSSETNGFMQTMQSLAEYANSGTDNLSLLFVAHKPLGDYFEYASRDVRNEFAKIEKRFSTHEIISDFSTFIKIMNQMTSTLKLELNNNDKIKIKQYVEKYRLFSDVFNDTEIENLIVNGSYPLHPSTVFLLPRVSTIFGQNERTLFSFLGNTSSVGLMGFSKTNNNFYYPDLLVDYFLVNIDKSYINEYKEYLLYKNHVNSLNTSISKRLLVNSKRVFKFLMLWSICGGNDYVRLEDYFIADSLDIDIDEVKEILQQLKNQKLIRFNIIQNHWELHRGSPFDISKELSLLDYSIFSNFDVYNLLDELNYNKYVYSKEYNAKNEITRFSFLSFLKTSKLSDYTVQIVFKDSMTSDHLTNYIIINENSSEISIKAKELLVLNDLSNRPDNKEKNIQDDLFYEVKMREFELSEIFNKIFNSESKFHLDGKDYSFDNIYEYEQFLSEKFSKKYPKYSMIINDQINMYKLTAIQERALITVLEYIMIEGSVEIEKYFEGNRPEYLIWYSLVKMDYASLKKEINKYLLKQPKGSYSNLVQLAMNEPYGFRPPVAILLVIASIAEKIKDMYFSKDSQFISNINAENIYFDSIAGNLEYTFSYFDNENREYLEKLSKEFPDISTNVINKSLNIQVCSGLYNWYLSLPVIIQQKKNLEADEVLFLRYIEKSKIEPQESIENIMADFPNFEELAKLKQRIENSFSIYLNSILKSIEKENGIISFNDWANSQSLAIKKSNKLIQCILSGENIINKYAEKVEELEITRWSLSTFDMLKRSIQLDIDACKSTVKSNKVTMNNAEKAVIVVELGKKAEILEQNLKNTINATSKYISTEEIEQIIYNLLNEYIK